jgi:transcriptional regulator with XRE-family HTH domain
MAQVLGLSRPSVVAIEQGRRQLSAVDLVLLAEWWHIKVEDLLP